MIKFMSAEIVETVHKVSKSTIFMIKTLKKFAVLIFIHTFAIPKIKQPLALGEKKRNVATKLNRERKWIL